MAGMCIFWVFLGEDKTSYLFLAYWTITYGIALLG